MQVCVCLCLRDLAFCRNKHWWYVWCAGTSGVHVQTDDYWFPQNTFRLHQQLCSVLFPSAFFCSDKATVGCLLINSGCSAQIQTELVTEIQTPSEIRRYKYRVRFGVSLWDKVRLLPLCTQLIIQHSLSLSWKLACLLCLPAIWTHFCESHVQSYCILRSWCIRIPA